MKTTENQREELRDVTAPLRQWLVNNCHPHCEVKVTSHTVELTETVVRIINKD